MEFQDTIGATRTLKVLGWCCERNALHVEAAAYLDGPVRSRDIYLSHEDDICQNWPDTCRRPR